MTEHCATLLRTAFCSQRTRPLSFRIQQLTSLKNCILDNKSSLIDALTADLGRCSIESILVEIVTLRREIDDTLSKIKTWTSPTHYKSPIALFPVKMCATIPEPRGVVLIISPWNYPIYLSLSPLVSAIAAGCVACIKPSEHSPNCSALLSTLLPKYLDPDAYVVRLGAIDETTALLEQKWDKIFFTGSTSVGKIVATAAAKTLTPVVIEAGGKSPVIIDTSAPLELTARRICYGKWLNNGQTCVAPDYALIDDDVFDDVIAAIKGCLVSFYGDTPASSCDYSRIINSTHLTRIKNLVSDALDKGGKLLTGSIDDVNEDDLYCPPIVLEVDVSLENFEKIKILKEEIFGPVLVVARVKSDFVVSCIDIINSQPNPLALYIFSTNKQTISTIISSTSSGGVCVNDTVVHLGTCLPFGGVGDSGMGSSHGKAGFDEFSHHKSVLHRGTSMEVDKGLRYPPYSERSSAWLERLALM
ncbi:hypothetical protein GEMRC1_001915 [Eukaryota sp. GEM-RC1]